MPPKKKAGIGKPRSRKSKSKTPEEPTAPAPAPGVLDMMVAAAAPPQLPMPSPKQCIARRANTVQCPHDKAPDSLLCKVHCKKLPNGTIHDKLDCRTNTGKYDVEKTKLSADVNYVAMWEHIIDNEKYLTDVSGNIYTFDIEHPRYLGKQTLDNKIDSSDAVAAPLKTA